MPQALKRRASTQQGFNKNNGNTARSLLLALSGVLCMVPISSGLAFISSLPQGERKDHLIITSKCVCAQLPSRADS